MRHPRCDEDSRKFQKAHSSGVTVGLCIGFFAGLAVMLLAAIWIRSV